MSVVVSHFDELIATEGSVNAVSWSRVHEDIIIIHDDLCLNITFH